MPNDRWMWDTTTTLEALGAADVALWIWEPERDRMRLIGALRAREALSAPGRHELIVADLDRLRRLNEALGHERADLVLAALGSRLAAAFPPEAILARIGEDEFAALAPTGASPGAEALRRSL